MTAAADTDDRKVRARTYNRARAADLKAQRARLAITSAFGEKLDTAAADAAGARALKIFDATMLGKRRIAAMRKRAEARRDDVAAVARARAKQHGADDATAEAAGTKALEEFDAAHKGRRAAKRHAAYVLLRTPGARAQIEAQKLWSNTLLPVRERALAALIVRHPDIALGEARQRANVVAAQLELRPREITRRLELFVRGTLADLLDPLPVAPTPKLQPRPSLTRRVLNRIWPKAASATK